MAGGISDSIELFIKELLKAQKDQIELQRNELAQQFNCAPSQINYVLATRFTTDHGYRIESRRGGGGYVRIVRIDVDRVYKLKAIEQAIGDELSQAECTNILVGLHRSQIVTLREARLIQTMLEGDALPEEGADAIRAKALKKALRMLQSQQ